MKSIATIVGLGVVFLSVTIGAGSPQVSASSAFDSADSADRAAEKIGNLRPQNPAEAAALQRACRDFCRRFPDSPQYPEVRRTAVLWWNLFAHMETILVEGWDPTDAERDPKLNDEQQADIAMLAAFGQARHRPDQRQPLADAEFEAVVAALPRHRNTRSARENLIRLAVTVAPERAIPRLREFYPDDPEATACIRLLESIGKPCEFRFVALDGRTVDSRDYLGKVVLLDFWARDCPPCLEGFPKLKKTAESYEARGFAVIGVNLDEARSAAEEIVRKYSLPWPQHFDGGGWKNELARRFMVSMIPNGVLIDRRGNLRFAQNNLSDEFATNQRIEMLLAEHGRL